jgi:hypothetical protein
LEEVMFALGICIGIITFSSLISMIMLVRINKKLKDSTDASHDLVFTLNQCIEEVRSVQTYGLRLQK